MRRISLALLTLVTVSLRLCVTAILATDYQQCAPSSTCTIGEFLYNDDYTALPSQTCTLTAKYPDGSPFITSQAMTSRADGWYSYDATISTTEGLYTATICCVPSAGTMCLDKSFEVKTSTSGGGSSLTAADVWNYNNRTLTSFGSLVSDIWNSSSRTLTSFGDLVSNIWTYNTRTTTSSTTSSSDTNTKIDALQADLDEQRLLLEKAIQEPLISLEMIDSGARLTTKLSDAEKNLDTLTLTLAELRTTTISNLTQWDNSSNTNRINLASALLTQADQINATLIFFTDSWDDPAVIEASTLSQTLLTALRDFKAGASKKTSGDLATILTLQSDLDSSFVALSNFVDNQKQRAELLDSSIQNLSSLTSQWDSQSPSRQAQVADNLKNSVLKINEYIGAPEILASAQTPQNTILALRAILGLNQALLANNPNSPVALMWLEEGSIIYKASLYNPSKLVSLEAPLSFYLPRETKDEHILEIDPTLSTYFDPDHDAIKVTGQYTLAPLSTKIVSVELEDIWRISDQELSVILTDSQNFATNLAQSNFYTQGLAMKTTIEQLVDKIKDNQNATALPTDRIRSFRENSLDLLTARQNLKELGSLVAQTESSRSLKGFLGGTQVASTWGILIVVLTGFVLIGLYLYRLNPTLATTTPTNSLVPVSRDTVSLIPSLPWSTLAIAAFTIFSVLGGIYIIKQRTPVPTPVNQIVTPTSTPAPSPTPVPSATVSRVTVPARNASQSGAGGSQQIVPPTGGSVNIRNKPSTTADIVMSIKAETEVIVFETDGDWSHIGFTAKDELKGYWVKSEFISSNN